MAIGPASAQKTPGGDRRFTLVHGNVKRTGLPEDRIVVRALGVAEPSLRKSLAKPPNLVHRNG
jgi:hypothetical protein